jgi:hypothetical protein
MGTDFLRAKAKRFRKGLDKGVVELTRAHLFSRAPDSIQEKVVAKAVGQVCVRAGESVLLHAHEGRLFVESDAVVRGEVVRPEEAFVKRLETAGGYAGATVAVSHPTLSLFEIVISGSYPAS